MKALMQVGANEYAVDLQPTRDCRNYLAVWTQRGLVRVSQGATPAEALAAAESDARAIEAYRGDEVPTREVTPYCTCPFGKCRVHGEVAS